MNYWHFITISVGVLMLFSGFYAAFEAKKPWDIIGSIIAPIGLVTALLGTLLLCVPNFFS